MQELIKLSEMNGQKVVSARDLHHFLESKKQFSDWIKNRIQKYGLIEGQDFTTFHQMVNRSKTTEYALTLDAAKELAMVEGNAKGKQARQYLIECERQTKAPTVIPKSQSELILMIAQQNVDHERRMQELEQRQQVLEAKLNTSTANYFSIMGYASLKNQRVGFREAATIGRKATAFCTKQGLTIETVPDARYGKVNIYPAEVLDQLFAEPANIAI